MQSRNYSLIGLFLTSAVLVMLTWLGAPPAVGQEEAAPEFDGAWRYEVSCASCHGDDGEGVSAFGPPLRGNVLVVNSPPGPIIQVIQEGRFNRNRAYPEYPGMPAFGKLRAGEARALVDFMKTGLQE